MNVRKRIPAMLTAVLLILSLLPAGALASEEPAEPLPLSEEAPPAAAETEEAEQASLPEASELPAAEEPVTESMPAIELDGASAAENEKTCFAFLTNTMGLNTASACGILANIYRESGFNPNVTGDSSTSYGICQWHDWGTNTGRFTNLKNFCSSNGYDYHTLEGQLYFLQYELTSSGYGLNYILKQMYTFPDTAQGAYDAGYYWCKEFGRPADSGENPRRGALSRDTYYPKYAAYTAPASYTVTFDAQGGISVSSRTVTEGLAVGTVPASTRQGYILGGWYTGRNGTGAKLTADTLVTGDIIYYAYWIEVEPETYVVSYDANGGSGSPLPQTKTQGAALTITATKPKRTGYTFLGWAESASALSAAYLPGGYYTRDADATLYAVWRYNYAPGDMDGDGIFSPSDAARILALIGTSSSGADADGSGAVTPLDAALVLQAAVQ